MSAQSIVIKDVLSNDEAMNQIVSEYSMDLLKYLRFDYGKVCHERIRETLRMKKLFCNRYCKIEEDSRRSLREAIIRKNILKFKSV